MGSRIKGTIFALGFSETENQDFVPTILSYKLCVGWK